MRHKYSVNNCSSTLFGLELNGEHAGESFVLLQFIVFLDIPMAMQSRQIVDFAKIDL